MLPDVVLGQRLLDQQQVERVEPAQQPGVGQRVRGVRVDLQQDQLAEPLPHRLTGAMSQPGLIFSLIRTYPSAR